MNKMDDFFKKRLNDFSEAEDGWNIPSEDLWEQAKKEFPKKESRSKRFIPWFLSFGLLALLVASFFILQNQNVSSSKIENLTQTQFTENNITKSNLANSISAKQEPAVKLESGNVSKNQSTPDKTKDSDANTTIDKKKIKESTISSGSSSIKKDIQKNQKKSKPIAAKKIESSSLLNGLSNQIVSHLEKQVVGPILNKSINVESVSDIPTTTPSNKLSSSPKSNISTESKRLLVAADMSPINKLPTRSNSLVSQHLMASATSQYLTSSKHFSWAKNIKKGYFEYGIALSAYDAVQPFEEVDNVLINELDDYNAESSQFGFNIHTNRIYQNGFSLSSGLMYSFQNLGVNVNIIDSYDGSDEYILRSETQLNQNQLPIQFYPNADLEAGDQLDIQGFFDMSINTVRLPIGVNYHINLNRFEAFVGVGLSVGLDMVRLSNASAFAYNDQKIVGKESSEIEGQVLIPIPQATAYAGAGLKYHINASYNIGCAVFVDKRALLPKEFVRSEIGIFKRI